MQPTLMYAGRAMPSALLGVQPEREPAPFAGTSNSSGRVSLPRTWAPLPFASLSSSVVNNIGKPSATNKDARTEPHTGVEYPLTFCHNKRPCPSLLGLG